MSLQARDRPASFQVSVYGYAHDQFIVTGFAFDGQGWPVTRLRVYFDNRLQSAWSQRLEIGNDGRLVATESSSASFQQVPTHDQMIGIWRNMATSQTRMSDRPSSAPRLVIDLVDHDWVNLDGFLMATAHGQVNGANPQIDHYSGPIGDLSWGDDLSRLAFRFGMAVNTPQGRFTVRSGWRSYLQLAHDDDTLDLLREFQLRRLVGIRLPPPSLRQAQRRNDMTGIIGVLGEFDRPLRAREAVRLGNAIDFRVHPERLTIFAQLVQALQQRGYLSAANAYFYLLPNWGSGPPGPGLN